MAEGCPVVALRRSERRMLSFTHERDRPRTGGVVETIHPVDRCRVGVSHQQGRVAAASGLAPETRPRAGPYPGVLFGLRDVEDAGPMDATIGPGDAPRSLLDELAKIR